LTEVAACRRHVAADAPRPRLERKRDRRDVLERARETVPRARIVVEEIDREHRFVGADPLREVVADRAEQKLTAVRVAETAVPAAGRIETRVIAPAADLALDADARQVLFREPDVVRQIAAIDRDQLLRRRHAVHRERRAVLADRELDGIVGAPRDVRVG
jgi:hypothetical protein